MKKREAEIPFQGLEVLVRGGLRVGMAKTLQTHLRKDGARTPVRYSSSKKKEREVGVKERERGEVKIEKRRGRGEEGGRTLRLNFHSAPIRVSYPT